MIFQQGGPEPLDAYRKFLEAAQTRGDFLIADRVLEDAFWQYYRDDQRHAFYAAHDKPFAEGKDRRSNATSASIASIAGIPDRYRTASAVLTRELHADEA